LQLLAAVGSVLDAIERYPKMFAQVHGEVRRALVSRFPYAVFYRAESKLGATLTMDPGLLGVAFTIVVVVVLLAPMLLARRRAEQERGLTPVFEAFCAGTFAWIGRTNIPMIRLSIYKNFLVIAVISPSVIPFTQLARAEVRAGLFGRRLFIELRRGTTYQLSVRDPESVVRLLQHT